MKVSEFPLLYDVQTGAPDWPLPMALFDGPGVLGDAAFLAAVDGDPNAAADLYADCLQWHSMQAATVRCTMRLPRLTATSPALR